MNDPAVPRRTFIGWAVSSLVVAPSTTAASMNASPQVAESLPKQGDRLFSSRVPAQAKQVLTRFAAGVYVAIYEVKTEERHEAQPTWSTFSTDRWLCMASEVEPGKFCIQTSGDALYASTNWHPVDVDVSILDSGDVEVVQGLTRGSSTTRWSRSSSKWELESMQSAGISGHRLWLEEYDRETRELVMRVGDPGESDDLFETTRYAVAETFTLADYGRKPLVDFA